MKNIEAVIFDLDGTLIDSIPVWQDIDKRYLEERGLTLTEEVLDAAHNMDFKGFAKFLKNYYSMQESPEKIIEDIISLVKEDYTNKVDLKLGVREYLDYLHQKGVKMAVATACVEELADIVLQKYDLYKYFDNVSYIKEVNSSKEEGDIYLLAAKKMGIRPERCLVYEDILMACQGAKKASCVVVPVFDISGKKDHQAMVELCGNDLVYDFRDLINE